MKWLSIHLLFHNFTDHRQYKFKVITKEKHSKSFITLSFTVVTFRHKIFKRLQESQIVEVMKCCNRSSGSIINHIWKIAYIDLYS